MRALTMTLFLASFVLVTAGFACAGTPNHPSQPPLKVVGALEVDRYLGRWFEIAKLPNRFQKGCDRAEAEYGRKEHGRLTVRNTCVEPNGKLRSILGEAWIPDTAGAPAKLKVSFLPDWLRFLGIGSPYWVVELDPDYQWSLVSEPGRKFMWILSRTPQLDRATWDRIQAVGREQGLPMEKLEFSRPDAVVD